MSQPLKFEVKQGSGLGAETDRDSIRNRLISLRNDACLSHYASLDLLRPWRQDEADVAENARQHVVFARRDVVMVSHALALLTNGNALGRDFESQWHRFALPGYGLVAEQEQGRAHDMHEAQQLLAAEKVLLGQEFYDMTEQPKLGPDRLLSPYSAAFPEVVSLGTIALLTPSEAFRPAGDIGAVRQDEAA